MKFIDICVSPASPHLCPQKQGLLGHIYARANQQIQATKQQRPTSTVALARLTQGVLCIAHEAGKIICEFCSDMSQPWIVDS